jgi:hypothetical protein
MTDLLGHNIVAPLADNIVDRLRSDFFALLTAATDQLNEADCRDCR